MAIANAILHKPKIIFLDEPTAGFDPLSRRAIWELLYQLAEGGTSLFVTTHYMEEAERCNTIAFISDGKILKIGQPADLRSGTSGENPGSGLPAFDESFPYFFHWKVSGVTVYGTTLNLNVPCCINSFRYVLPNPQSPIPNPQSPIPISISNIVLSNLIIINACLFC